MKKCLILIIFYTIAQFSLAQNTDAPRVYCEEFHRAMRFEKEGGMLLSFFPSEKKLKIIAPGNIVLPDLNTGECIQFEVLEPLHIIVTTNNESYEIVVSSDNNVWIKKS